MRLVTKQRAPHRVEADMIRGEVTYIKVDYDCPRQCSYTLPTAIPANGSALRHASAVDTVLALLDITHKETCPGDADEPEG